MSVLVGKKAPNFSAQAVVNGGEFVSNYTLEQFIGKKPVLLFFYPKDFTFVCPTELFAFQNALSLVDYQADKATITNKDLEYATELLLKQRGRTIKDMERNDLFIPNVDDDEDEEYYEDFYQ